MNRFRFIKVRDVKTPSRGNVGDAGLDFFIPNDLSDSSLHRLPSNKPNKGYVSDFVTDINKSTGIVTKIHLYPGGKVLIPSGIKPLLEPQASMLMAANKSGLASGRGILYTAEIVDSPYTGEIHLGIINLSKEVQVFSAGDKVTQFIHVPVYLTEPEEISNTEFYSESQIWGTRGDGGFNSTGDK